MIESWNTNNVDIDTYVQNTPIACQRTAPERAAVATAILQVDECSNSPCRGTRRTTRAASKNTQQAAPAGTSMATRQPNVPRRNSVAGMAIGDANAPQMVRRIIRCVDLAGSILTNIAWVIP
ncbi:MAG: hypothetical protein VXZ06_06565 [Actinomycetota bacterium]|nr:hypothetical protein [Actinomycetota bacterium]